MRDRDEFEKDLRVIAYAKSDPFCYQCYQIAPSGRCVRCGSDDLMRHVAGVGVEYGTEWVVEHLLKSELDEIDDDALHERYDEMLEECYPEPVKICGYEYDQAHALKQLDPVTYRCGFSDWLSSEDGETIISFDNGSTYFDMNELDEWIDENLPEEGVA